MMQDKKWFALEITAVSETSEAVEFALNELNALGTEINNLGKIAPETLKIIGYFNEKVKDEALYQALDYAVRIYGFSGKSIRKTEWREVESRDWLAEWKKHWRATETEKFIIAPTWETIENKEKIVIRIEPSMAFGTGTHETTRLCLRAIEKNYKPEEMSFLDVGTGTGILAIAAAKLQGKSYRSQIAGCDTDENSIAIAKENAVLNQTEDIRFYVGSIDAQIPPFDFVCANLTLDVIVSLLPVLHKKARRQLILSGILKEQENAIVQKLKELGLKNFAIETLGEWISVQVKKS
jgi:ribosomal protein L11 methyltransferase